MNLVDVEIIEIISIIKNEKFSKLFNSEYYLIKYKGAYYGNISEYEDVVKECFLKDYKVGLIIVK